MFDCMAVIDEVGASIYQQDIVIESPSVFGSPFRSRSGIYCFSCCVGLDVIDTSLTRREIAEIGKAVGQKRDCFECWGDGTSDEGEVCYMCEGQGYLVKVVEGMNDK